MGLRRKAVQGVWWSAVTNFGLRISSFIILFFLARLLDPADFGLMALAGVAVNISQIFVGSGLSAAIVQRSELDPEHLDSAFWMNVAVAAVLTLTLILCAGLIAEFFEQPALTPIIRVASIALLIGALSQVHMSLLRRTLAFRALAIRSLAAEPVGGVVAVVMAFNGYGVWSLVARQLVVSVVRLVILWWCSGWRPGRKVSWQHFKDLFSFGVSMLGSSVIQFFSKQADVALIGYFLGPVALGYYNMAYRLFQMLTESIGGTVNSVAWPVFSRLQDNTDKLRKAFYESAQLVCLVTWPVFLGFFILAPDLVSVVLGSKWNPSIPVIQLLAFLGILQTMLQLNASVIVGLGKPHWHMAYSAVKTAVNVTGFVIAVRWGIVAVAASYVIVGYLLAPVSISMVRRLAGIRVLSYLSLYAVPVTGSLVMLLAIFSVQYVLEGALVQLFQLFLLIVIGASVYVFSIYVLSPSLVYQFTDLVKNIRSSQREKGSRSG